MTRQMRNGNTRFKYRYVYTHMSMKYEDMKRLAKKMLEKMREYKMA
jgi:hypothetical protein